eukprot:SM000203S06132  [mRNA]  locus=s203:2:2632:- [translate_table: standard]
MADEPRAEPPEAAGASAPDAAPRASQGPRAPPGPVLDLTGASIQGSTDDRNPSIVLPNQSHDVTHFAVDLGGSLIKIVYFSRHPDSASPSLQHTQLTRINKLSARSNFPVLGGRLHFVKFETNKLSDALDFIESKQLHSYNTIGLEGQEDTVWGYGAGRGTTIKATGGGAFKYAHIFKEKLDITLDKEDEMKCIVAGLNFLIRAMRDEAFTHLDGLKQFIQLDSNDPFPYLLVNIGSGVSILKVDGPGKYERVSGTNVGGGTFWGLGRLLTKCTNFDEILELSQSGDNIAVDMLVGDIYGGLDYAKVGTTVVTRFIYIIGLTSCPSFLQIGLSASTIASSFG